MDKSRLFISYGVKYEPQWLVDDMQENLHYADCFAEVDCRARETEFWIHEGEYRRLQRKALLEAGIRRGDWVLVTSPDERWDDSGEQTIRELMDKQEKAVYVFPLREMWNPTQYRVDGIWGRKTRPRLYPFEENQIFSDRRLQSIPVPVYPRYPRRFVPELNLYHLKTIEPESRKNRALAYEVCDPRYKLQSGRSHKSIDPEGRFAAEGYHYLYNEDGLETEEIPEGKGFSPAYDRPYIFKPNFVR